MDDVSLPITIARRRVLVVDDDPSIRELMHVHLRNAGYAVQLANDAIEAGYMVLQSPPDLLIVDVDMPFLDGLDFVATLAADTTIPPIPAILITAHEAYEDQAAILGAAFLRKPFQKEDLLKTVERMMGDRPQLTLHYRDKPPPLGHEANDSVFM